MRNGIAKGETRQKIRGVLKMAKRSFILFGLTLLLTVSLFLGLYNVQVSPHAEDYGTVQIQEDYTQIALVNSEIAESENIINGPNEFGLLPSLSGWAGVIHLGTGYAVYRIEAESGMLLSELSMDFTVRYGGNSIAENHALPADFKVYTGTSLSSLQQEYSLFNDATIANTEGTVKGAGIPGCEPGKSFTYQVSLRSTLASPQSALYVKVVLESPDMAEYSLSFCPVTLTKTSIVAQQVKQEGVEIRDNFHEIYYPTKDEVVPFAFAEKSNVLIDEGEWNGEYYTGSNMHGALPTSQTNWAGEISLTTGYLKYRLDAGDGAAFGDLVLRLTALYNPASYDGDISVEVSGDDETYYPFVKMGESGLFTAQAPGAADSGEQTASVNLSSAARGKQVLYVKIVMECETADAVALAYVPVKLFGVSFSGAQLKTEYISIKDNFRAQAYGSESEVIPFQGALTNVTVGKNWDNGQYIVGNDAHGLIPSTMWGDPVPAGSGYLTYAVNAAPGYVLEDLTLRMELLYDTTFNNGGFRIAVSTDNKNYAQISDLVQEGLIQSSVASQTVTMNLDSYAKNRDTLYVRIYMDCPEGQINLSHLPVKLYNVSLDANQKTLPVYVGDSFREEKYDSADDVMPKNYYEISNIAFWQGVGEDGKYGVGNDAHGSVPASAWGAVLDVDPGYLVYKISTLSADVLTDLNLTLEVAMDRTWLEYYGIDESMDFVILVSDDNIQYTEVCKLYADGYVVSAADQIQRVTVSLKEEARDKSALYVKVLLDCTATEPVEINYSPLKLYSVSITGNTIAEGSVFLQTNGGTLEDGDTMFTYDVQDTIYQLPTPQKTGYVFQGWYTSADFSGDAVTGADLSVLRDYSFYAKWEIVTYAFSVQTEGSGSVVWSGGDLSEKTSVSYEDVLELTLQPQEGYLVYGLQVNGEAVRLSKDNAYTVKEASGELTLKATFVPRASHSDNIYYDYTSYGFYSGEWKEGVYDYYNLELAAQYVHDEDGHASLCPPDTANTGDEGYVVYRFVAPGSRVFHSATLSMNARLFDLNLANKKEKVDVYVSTDGVEYDLAYKSTLSQFGDILTDISVNLKQYMTDTQEFYVKIVVGSNVLGWTMLRTVGVSLEYKKAEVSLNFGDFQSSVYDLYIGDKLDTAALAQYIKPGYELASDQLYLDENFQTAWDPDAVISDASITLYAKTSKISYQITYQMNGGDNAAENSDSITCTDTLALQAPAKEGSEFVGWYLTSDFSGEPVTELSEIYEDVTLYAKWFEGYQITYQLNEGENNAQNAQKYFSSQSVTLYAPTREGYEFGGWYADAECTQLVTSIEQGRSGDITLYAKWVKAETPQVEIPQESHVNVVALAVSGAVVVVAGAVAVFFILRKKGKRS